MAIMPPAGYELVDAPERTPIEGGIFDALPGQKTQPLDGHALRGVTYELDATMSPSIINEAGSTPVATSSKAAEFGDIEYETGDPFTIFVSKTSDRILRSPEDLAAQAEAHLVAASQRGVERVLWNRLLPLSGGIDLNPAGALSVKDAVGVLEEYAGSNYFYTPTLHFGRRLAPYLADHFLVKFDEGNAAAIGGARAVNGAGYVGQSGPFADPDDQNSGVVAAADERWLWLTGQPQIWEGAPQSQGGFDQNTNKIFAFSERTYIVTTDGLNVAVRVKLS